MERKRNITSFIRLEFPSLTANISIASAAISAFAKQLSPAPTQKDLYDITSAVEEAVQNAIVHAYPSNIGLILLKASIYNRNIIEIVVSDKGRGIENVEQAIKPGFTTSDLDHAGIGFSMIEHFMTKLDVRSTLGIGTTVTMQYQIPQQ